MKIPMKLADSEEMLTFKTAFKFPPVNVGGEKDHSKLENLDYANSGHTGFASSEDIPTKVSQLENDKGYIDNSASNLVNYELKGKTGTNLGVSIDNTTYVMTIDLKNTAGDVISTGSVDLPLESMVIGASYDDSTKEVVLTLQSGEEVRFSVADLVSGLVSQSTFDTKMNEISQEFSHKFDMPYYYEYNGDTDFEDTSETTLAMFNEIKELMEAGQKPCIIVKKGATGANSYITYHFVVPQFGSLDTTYIMLKGSPVRKDGSTFNLVALNCEKDPETNQIKRVYEKKTDGSIEISGGELYIEFTNADNEATSMEKAQQIVDNILDGKTFSAHFRHSTYRTVGLESWDLDYNGGKFGLWFRYKSLNYTKDYANQENVWCIFYKFNTSTNKLTSRIYQGQTSGTPLIRYSKYGSDIETMSNMALSIKNSDEYTPTTDYHPSTKLYTDQRVQSIAPNYNATSTYKVGDYVSYQGKFYKCTTAIETAEAWNSEHWSETTAKDEFGKEKNIIIAYNEADDTLKEKLTYIFHYWKENNGLPTNVYYEDDYRYLVPISSIEVTPASDYNTEIIFSSIYFSNNSTASYNYVHYKTWFPDGETISATVQKSTVNNKKLAAAWGGDSYYFPGALLSNNTKAYAPTGDYNPATKKYVDDKLTTITGYDATKTQTLKNINGVLTWQTDGE